MQLSRSLVLKIGGPIAGGLLTALYFLPGSTLGLYLEGIFGISNATIITWLMIALGITLFVTGIFLVALTVANRLRPFQAEIDGKNRFLLGETVHFKARFKGELKSGLFTSKVRLPNGSDMWWPAYDTFHRSESGDLGVLSGRKLHEAEWAVPIPKNYPVGQYVAQIGIWDRVDSHNQPVKEKSVSFLVLSPGYMSAGTSSGDTTFVNQPGFLDAESVARIATLPLEAQLRLEPPVGFEKIPEPSRSEIIAPLLPQSGFMRSQQVYVKAINGDLTDCEVKLVVDGNGVDHMLWEGIRRQPPASAKEKLTIHRDDEKYLTLWYAQQKDRKEYLYIPITTSPHMPQYIGSERSPLVVDIWIIADGFSGKRQRFIIYRESWEGILAKEVGEEDGIPFAEFDALWHLSSEIRPAPPLSSQNVRGSDKASILHISHRGKTISLTGKMGCLKPSHQYQVEIRPSYIIGELIPETIGGPRTIFTTEQNGEASWSFIVSADELTDCGLKRFSVWIGEVTGKAYRITVLLSDNISFHN